MIDIHSHVLPLVDDGSQDMEESLEMLKQSAESGVKILTVTPHANQRGRFENYNIQDINRKFRLLKSEMEKEKIPLRLVLGMEIFASDDLQELIEDRRLLGLNMSDYYLVEFPFGADEDYIFWGLDQVFRAGGTPVIAHPERYACIQRNPAIIYDWLGLGVFTQVNKGSILGNFGERVQLTADYLLRYDLVTCVGSDAHSPEVRTTNMAELQNYLQEVYGKEYMRKVTRDNAFRILKNQDVPHHGHQPDPDDAPPVMEKRTRRRFIF